MKERILIVEDQFIEANTLQMMLEKSGYHVCTIARSVTIALKIVEEEKPDFVFLDIFLQGPLTGIDLARSLREKNIPFVYLSANSDKEILETAKATHPYGFLVKPFRERDVLVALDIARYLHENSLEARLRREPALEKRLSDLLSEQESKPVAKVYGSASFNGIIGNSEPLRHTMEHVAIVAPTDTSVLILGESGTGKERVADCIHHLSGRRAKPLVKVNCAALPSTLIESELFGHEKGSFTGATEKRVGKFEQADGGTIFLDEIGEMPFEVQVKLLRVLQSKEIERIGGRSTIKLDVRVIAATNRVLEEEVAEGRFRIDLYYRLNVFPIELSPLRERKDDIPALAYYFTDNYSRKLGKKIVGFSDDVLNRMMKYDWPGNIRELENTIERSILLTKGDTIRDIHLPAALKKKESGSAGADEIKTMEENERDHILQVLKKCKGKVFGKGGAAELLGMNVSTLNSRIKRLGIKKEKFFE